jgi:four helix bundle protein
MITSYKDLNVWQKADRLAMEVFDLTDRFPKAYLYDLTNQLRRAVLSVPTNIAEGCASFHSREFLQYLNVARRSLSETHYLLNFACNRDLIDHDRLSDLDSIAEEIGKMINSLVHSIRLKNEHKPPNTDPR